MEVGREVVQPIFPFSLFLDGEEWSVGGDGCGMRCVGVDGVWVGLDAGEKWGGRRGRGVFMWEWLLLGWGVV